MGSSRHRQPADPRLPRLAAQEYKNIRQNLAPREDADDGLPQSHGRVDVGSRNPTKHEHGEHDPETVSHGDGDPAGMVALGAFSPNKS